jgi:hypothetical protein
MAGTGDEAADAAAAAADDAGSARARSLKATLSDIRAEVSQAGTEDGLSRVHALLNILLKTVVNILDHPGEAKYRRIKLTNRTFAAQVVPVAPAMTFLKVSYIRYRPCLP